ncbi:glutamyl-tRNA reductase [Pseudofulvibacter geojedonensis]|uniref:Glutamyl-tRNA reductase n=1 Tax=Pseudofulvibacter geojedonensis TaxID=1123758 RepID=A0ABW3I3E1_9FLAO
MQNRPQNTRNTFYAIGLSYKKADAEMRGRFSLDNIQKELLLEKAKQEGVSNLLITSTCNRTELYGFAQHPFQLIKHLCDITSGTVEEFQKVAYIYKSNEAISHMFKMGTGLDSQILGDFEIISQLKASFNLSKKHQMVDAFTERLVNAVIQASKKIKNETEISSGATSVSFASVQYILNNVTEVSDKNILLFGTGKIGRNTCENLVKHIDNKHVSLINRTKDKAEKIAGKFDVTVKDYANLQAEISQSDIVIVATGAQQPTIDKEVLAGTNKELLLLDLSIPKNISDDVLDLPNVRLVHLDDLSKMTDETLEKRKAYIPKAQEIIEEIKSEFLAWLETRKFAPAIKALKSKLQEIKSEEIDFQRRKNNQFDQDQAEVLSDRIIQKITKHFANHLKDDSTSTDESIAVISKVFQL